MAGRVRTLADAVNELTAEVARTRERLGPIDTSRLDGRARETAQRLALAVEAFVQELARTNQHLGDLARRPIVGFLGGGAEAELQRLVGRVDALRAELSRGVAQIAPR